MKWFSRIGVGAVSVGLFGGAISAAHDGLPQRDQAPLVLQCTSEEGCRVTCFQAGAGDAARAIVVQRSGVVRVERIRSGWLRLDVAPAAFAPNNRSTVMRIARTTTCAFDAMVPSPAR